MILPTVDSEILGRVQQTVEGYGKIGLLIDDAPEARSRAARSIYGAEALPEWWLVGRSLTCARSLFSALRDALVAQPGLLAIAVVDRYLPVSCDQQSSRLVAWDVVTEGLEEGDDALCEEINDSVSWLDQRNRSTTSHPGLFLELETSYPHGFSGPRRSSGRCREASLPWKTRSTDLLYRLRGRIQERKIWTLLKYGPSDQLVTEVADPELNWRAQTWRSTLEELVQALRQQTADRPVILLTGAGASRRVGRLSSGMPPTEQLLQEACRQVAESDRPRGLNSEASSAPPTDPRCICEASAQPESSKARKSWDPKKGSTPVQWLVSHVASGGSVDQCEWSLEKLFSVEMNKRRPQLLKQFYDAFRSALHQQDHVFPYHHWLLAQLPWTRIITTNFDGFHERAAAAAVASRPLSKADRDHTLSLGRPLPLEAETPAPQLRERRRLSKTHGSLLFPAELELGLKQLKQGQKRLQSELETLLDSTTEKVWLVVVGHSMRDIYLDHLRAFQARESTDDSSQRIRLVWVVPEALKRCRRVTPSVVNRPRAWDLWMFEDWNQGRGESGPFPARVSEFAYDLWQLYHNGS